MLIGILSDSHGRHLAVRAAIKYFHSLPVAKIIHCGDVGGMDVFTELAGHDVAFVWGNTDDTTNGPLNFIDTLGLSAPTCVPLCLDCDGKKIAVFHGHEPQFQDLAYLKVDYILHGHTHVAADERMGNVRVINPGALHRAPRKTIATLDTKTDRLTFHELPTL